MVLGPFPHLHKEPLRRTAFVWVNLGALVMPALGIRLATLAIAALALIVSPTLADAKGGKGGGHGGGHGRGHGGGHGHFAKRWQARASRGLQGNARQGLSLGCKLAGVGGARSCRSGRALRLPRRSARASSLSSPSMARTLFRAVLAGDVLRSLALSLRYDHRRAFAYNFEQRLRGRRGATALALQEPVAMARLCQQDFMAHPTNRSGALPE